MSWDPTVPATNADLLSAPVRGNFAALDTQIVAPFAALANGQILYKAAGVLGGVPAGTNGYILTLVGGVPLWQPAPTGVAYPLLAPDGTVGAPSYAFAAAPGSGLSRDAATGNLYLRGVTLVALVANGRTLASWWISAANAWNPGDDNALDIGEATFRPRDLWLGRLIDHTALAVAPATPAAGHVITYAKTDKKYYAKDDAGVETPLGGSAAPAVVPLSLDAARFPDGTAGNLFPQPIERVSTGTPPANSPKLVELVYQFDAVAIESLIWKGVTPPDYRVEGAVTLVVKFSMLSATTGNVRLIASLHVIVDGATDVRATTGLQTITADVAVPATLGQQKEIRLPLNVTGTGAGPGQKFLVSTGLILAGASNATGDRVLEAAWLEFAR